jgi:hypothetical protein
MSNGLSWFKRTFQRHEILGFDIDRRTLSGRHPTGSREAECRDRSEHNALENSHFSLPLQNAVLWSEQFDPAQPGNRLIPTSVCNRHSLVVTEM